MSIMASTTDAESLQFSGALFSLIGVVVGTVLTAGLTLGRDWLRERQERKRHACYLAIRVVCILDEFRGRCTEIVGDDGTYHGQRNADDCLEAQVSLQDGILFPDDVDWKAIDPPLMYRILQFPSQIKTVNDAISSFGEVISDPADREEYFEERQYRYACLGLEAVDLAQTLRRRYTIPDRDVDDGDPVKRLRDRKAEIERHREERSRQPAAIPSHQPFSK